MTRKKTTKTRLGLIDGDILVHTGAQIGENKLDFDEVDSEEVYMVKPEKSRQYIDNDVNTVIQKLKLDKVIVCLSDPVSNFRRTISATYKANRKGRKPYLHQEMRMYVEETYETMMIPHLEADDVMGIIATAEAEQGGKPVICSIDKDMKTVPGWLYDYKSKPTLIPEWEADYHHMYQTLVGDSTDNYPGCPGIGPKKAEKILAELEPDEYWTHVVTAFESKGLTEEDALVQAQLARILRHDEYDWGTGFPILWKPKGD